MAEATLPSNTNWISFPAKETALINPFKCETIVVAGSNKHNRRDGHMPACRDTLTLNNDWLITHLKKTKGHHHPITKTNIQFPFSVTVGMVQGREASQ